MAGSPSATVQDFANAVAEPVDAGRGSVPSKVDTYQNMTMSQQLPAGFGGLQPAGPPGVWPSSVSQS